MFRTAGSVLKNHDSNDNGVHDGGGADEHNISPLVGTVFQAAMSPLLKNDVSEDSKGGLRQEDTSVLVAASTNIPSLHSLDTSPLADDASLPMLQDKSVPEQKDLVVAEEESLSGARASFFLNLKIKGVNHYIDWREVLRQLWPHSHATIGFRREPTNEYDSNAIQAFLVPLQQEETHTGSSNNNNINNDNKTCREEIKIGYVDRLQAEVLTSLLDQGRFVFAAATAMNDGKAVKLVRCFRTTLGTRVHLTSTTTNHEFLCSSPMGLGTTIDGCLSGGGSDFAHRDWEASKASPYTLPGSVRLLQWDPSVVREETTLLRGSIPPADTKPAPRGTLEQGWATSSNVSSSTAISANERSSDTCWPPSDDILSVLGLGGAIDKEWWEETAGLLPPSEWIVHGAYDLIGDVASSPLSLESATQVQRAKEVLDGAIHGASNVWTDDGLDDIKQLMHSDYFWLNRKGESYIRAFGGPYVLGQ